MINMDINRSIDIDIDLEMSASPGRADLPLGRRGVLSWCVFR